MQIYRYAEFNEERNLSSLLCNKKGCNLKRPIRIKT